MEIDLSRAIWHKSSFSNGSGGNCVEVAHLIQAVAVRDSKDPDGPKLIFATAEWTVFLRGVRDGELGL